MGRTPAGFTLIETTVIVAVAGVLLAVALPSFAEGLRRQRIATTMHLLSVDFAMARSTALMRRTPVVVCPGSIEHGCRPDHDWGGGWLVFEDADGDRQPGTDEVLRASEPNASASGGFRIASTRPFLRYQRNGYSAHSNLSVHLCVEDQLRGSVIVSRLGRVRGIRPTVPVACPGA